MQAWTESWRKDRRQEGKEGSAADSYHWTLDQKGQNSCGDALCKESGVGVKELCAIRRAG